MERSLYPIAKLQVSWSSSNLYQLCTVVASDAASGMSVRASPFSQNSLYMSGLELLQQFVQAGSQCTSAYVIVTVTNTQLKRQVQGTDWSLCLVIDSACD
jgi:hypothetical protein